MQLNITLSELILETKTVLEEKSPDMNQVKNEVYVSNLSVYCVVLPTGKSDSLLT